MPGSACEQLLSAGGSEEERRVIVQEASEQGLSRREVELLRTHAERLGLVIGSSNEVDRSGAGGMENGINNNRAGSGGAETDDQQQGFLETVPAQRTRVFLEEALTNLLTLEPEITIGAVYPKLRSEFPDVSKMRMKKLLSERRAHLAVIGHEQMDAQGSVSALDRVGQVTGCSFSADREEDHGDHNS